MCWVGEVCLLSGVVTARVSVSSTEGAQASGMGKGSGEEASTCRPLGPRHPLRSWAWACGAPGSSADMSKRGCTAGPVLEPKPRPDLVRPC